MSGSNFCPFGCNLLFPNEDKIKCHSRCNIQTVDRGTQTGPVIEDFLKEDEERQFLAVMMQQSTVASILNAARRETVFREQLLELRRELIRRRQADRQRRHEVPDRAQEMEDIVNEIAENERRQQELIQQHNLAEIQQPPPEALEHRPRQQLMEVRQAQQDLAELQPPVQDLPELPRIYEELIDRKRPRLELVVGEQPPEEILEPQPESVEGQQS